MSRHESIRMFDLIMRSLLAILFNHKPWNPDLRMFDLRWTDRELVDNHAMCMNHARYKGMIK